MPLYAFLSKQQSLSMMSLILGVTIFTYLRVSHAVKSQVVGEDRKQWRPLKAP